MESGTDMESIDSVDHQFVYVERDFVMVSRFENVLVSWSVQFGSIRTVTVRVFRNSDFRHYGNVRRFHRRSVEFSEHQIDDPPFKVKKSSPTGSI